MFRLGPARTLKADMKKAKAAPSAASGGERLQKILAAAGIASRRKAEELIAAGRVVVNGQTVSELGSKADPARDHIRVDGKPLKPQPALRYLLLNKPKGVVTTVSDPEGRRTVMDFVPVRERVFPVGRLDYYSEGLVLLTNDGELANQLTRSRSRIERKYLVKVSGSPSEEALARLRHGVRIDRGRSAGRDGHVKTQPARIRLVRAAANPWYEVVLVEGKNREIRKMFEEVGHFVEKIRRVSFGPLVLDTKPGEVRELTSAEVAKLKRSVSSGASTSRGGPAPNAKR